MKADLSRDSYDARKHYAAVLQQQGRVQVDSDWNEQQQIHSHRLGRLAADLLGASGVPTQNPGFGLAFTDDGSDLVITPGRLYVDGLLCELDPGEIVAFTSDGSASASVPLPRTDLATLGAGQWVLIDVGNADAQLLRITAVTVGEDALTLAFSGAVTRPATPASGSFNGQLHGVTTYLTQPDLPAAAFAASGNGASTLSLAAGIYLVYLDVWQRTVTALDDPSIRETALGGPDTAARLKTVWQLQLLAVNAPAGEAPACGTGFPEWDALTRRSSGALAARAAPPEGQAGPCLIPPGGGYQGLENQLYRVEVHQAGNDGGASFKWSRDNGSVVMRVLGFDGARLTLDGTGPDDALGLANGQWVELLGDVEELQGRPGQLLQIATVDPATAVVTFNAPPAVIDAAQHPKLRRWDSAGAVPVPAGGGDWIDLEMGVQVRFGAGSYATGDYWLLPARAGSAATVEWPHAAAQPPRSGGHRYARLGLVRWSGSVSGSAINDCRPAFSPLTEIPPALHVTGISWPNDDVLQLGQFLGGLSIGLDGAPIGQYSVGLDPNAPASTLPLMTAGDGAVTVTLEMPVPIPNWPNATPDNPAPTMPSLVVLPSRSITWNDDSGMLTWIPDSTVVQSVTGGQARVHVRLRGDFIWGDQGQQRLYLDGRTRGRPGLSVSRTQSLRTDLAFPSGSGQRSSDFESWFVLQFAPTPVSLRSFRLGQSVLIGGGTVAAQVVLANLAQNPVDVAIGASSNPQIAVDTGGSAVTVPAGQSSATFNVTVAAPATSSVVTVTVSVPQVADPRLVTTMAFAFNVVVLSVAASPPTALLLAGGTQQFSAGVSGVGLPLPAGVSTGVVWSCSGGTIDASGAYRAPSTAGTFVVTATSLADPSRSGQAVVTVRVKGKDKDKDKENNEKLLLEKAVTRETNKLRETLPLLTSSTLGPLGVTGVAGVAPAAPVQTVAQRSFITPAERPEVAAPPSSSPSPSPSAGPAQAPSPAAHSPATKAPALSARAVPAPAGHAPAAPAPAARSKATRSAAKPAPVTQAAAAHGPAAKASAAHTPAAHAPAPHASAAGSSAAHAPATPAGQPPPASARKKKRGKSG